MSKRNESEESVIRLRLEEVGYALNRNTQERKYLLELRRGYKGWLELHPSEKEVAPMARQGDDRDAQLPPAKSDLLQRQKDTAKENGAEDFAPTPFSHQ